MKPKVCFSFTNLNLKKCMFPTTTLNGCNNFKHMNLNAS